MLVVVVFTIPDVKARAPLTFTSLFKVTAGFVPNVLLIVRFVRLYVPEPDKNCVCKKAAVLFIVIPPVPPVIVPQLVISCLTERTLVNKESVTPERIKTLFNCILAFNAG